MLRSILIVSAICASCGFRMAPGAAPRAGRSRLFEAAAEDSEAALVPMERMDDRFEVSKGEVLRGEADDEVAIYVIDAEVPAKTMESLRNNLERQWGREMNIPGFRKGQIPPFMKAEVLRFVCREAVQQSMFDALGLYDLSPTLQDDQEMYEFVSVNGMEKEEEWMPVLSQEWKPKSPLTFHMKVAAKRGQEEE
uniref:Trigger factor ribosome-binding bacterial domain-containing protein n=1 Tax=Pinguiococcus pyrenoidosus TaxID=172671 RepID=A0A7R9YGN8_9STRA|mmetsp:Transcript_9366/g.35070  ORF Transcript_9366/g.35070 Transcript_9366/m.35070 type:complete len:194 (+) Transcript_9366:56-637(+)